MNTALLSTTPRLKPKSSTNDLAPSRQPTSFVSNTLRQSIRLSHFCCRLALATRLRERILAPATKRRLNYRHKSGRDSDLEAFSHNPSDGSFAPSAYQPST